ncbi:CDP-glycerol glycerophosphotransferase family protein [Pseudomonas sp. PSB11]|uniref:CDP-glycerol glycerophosphotransferase family protein n=1 Tax=Pseudomonas sp. PSB11 TaxID=2021969 RepID=UPI0016613539|nr:CDP-glycerol glycerophosphotransferase family protein [Pseudomonas sp. PSB11]
MPTSECEKKTEQQEVTAAKVTARKKYSIVSAVYNVARYLDEYLESVINQTVDFKNSIEIILVDDGSTDDSLEVIKKWINLHPKNIRYIYQENAGQGAARNHGLQYAKHEWVTFIDPDDFISNDYFELIDKHLSESTNAASLKMICANYIFYYEDSLKYSDTHALKFRFSKGDITLPIEDLGRHIILNVNCVLFKRSQILQQQLQFHPLIRPGFEDGNFVNNYLLNLKDGHVSYLAKPKYFYRKREDGTSTLDTGWLNPGRYSAQLELGYLGIINNSLALYGEVKPFIQRVVLYDLCWHFKRFINNSSKLTVLSANQVSNYKKLISEIMQHISIETIMNFELAGAWFYHKLGLLSLYKDHTPKLSIVYVDALDAVKNLVKVRYFSRSDNSTETIKLDNKIVLPTYVKTLNHTLFDDIFIYEHIIWFKLEDSKKLTITVENFNTRISLKGKQHHHGVSVDEINNCFSNIKINETNLPEELIELRKSAASKDATMKYGGCWLLMDRDTQADDNAEHLYKYLQAHHPEIRAYFVLRETSPDWNRLTAAGFSMLAFESHEHKLALLNANHLISSHADHYIFGGIDRKHVFDILTYKYTFLQHGVTKDDLSSWLNSKPIDLLITCTHPETTSFIANGAYKFTEKEVVLTGFPRHDQLIGKASAASKVILVMPTWRSNLVGAITGIGNERELNPEFSNTTFALQWKNFLHSAELENLHSTHGYKIVFYPHAYIQPYIETFEVPSFIEIAGHNDETSIQDHFSRASILVTDYSSVAFEMAALERAIVYFQFDASSFFGGNHTYKAGYFDYKLDGFGPVCETLNEALKELEHILSNNSQPSDKYLTRMRTTFAFHDQDNCKRVYEAINALDKCNISAESTQAAAVSHGKKMLAAQRWEESLTAWNQVTIDPYFMGGEAAFSKAVALKNLGKYDEALSWLDISNSAGYCSDKIKAEHFSITISTKNFVQINELFDIDEILSKSVPISDEILAFLAKFFREQKKLSIAASLLKIAEDTAHPAILVERAAVATGVEMWADAQEIWLKTSVDLMDNHTWFLRAQTSRMLGNVSEAYRFLKNIKNIDQLPEFSIEQAEILYAQAEWKKAHAAWVTASVYTKLSADQYLKFAKTSRKAGKSDEALNILTNAASASDERTLLQETALIFTAMGKLKEARNAWKGFLSRKDLRPNRDAWLHLAKVSYDLKEFQQSLQELEKFETLSPPTKVSQKLRKEIQQNIVPALQEPKEASIHRNITKLVKWRRA